MADITITASSVLKSSTAKYEHGTAGETITAGQVVYLDQTTTGEWLLADADAATAAARGSGRTGVALNGASDGQPITVATEGDVTIGGTLTAGVVYVLSATAGGIAPQSDLLSGDYVTVLGVAKSTTVLALDIQYSGVATA